MIDYKPYILTEKQVKEIKNGDQNAINKFYIDNIDIFTRMAKKFIRKNNYYKLDYLDLLHQLYLDIPILNYTDKKNLFFSIRVCFMLCENGGYKVRNRSGVLYNKYICPLYAKNNDNEELLLTDYLFIHEKSVEEEVELKEEIEEQETKVLNIINNMNIPNKNREKEIFILKLIILFGYSQRAIKKYYNELWKLLGKI
ncbi:MAG: hypothetical protein PUK83_06605 [Clostridia bacterium]|nr:hypothetical protein [Clostridia bacterium]MDY5264069.1 hypothetical protein [Eubacteriales bacterium]